MIFQLFSDHVGRVGGRAAAAGRGEQEGELHPGQRHNPGGEWQPNRHSGDMLMQMGMNI